MAGGCQRRSRMVVGGRGLSRTVGGMEGAVSARTRRGGGRARYTAAAGSPRGEFWRCPPSRAGSSPASSPRYAAAAKAAARAAFFIGVFPPVSRFESGRQHQVRRSQCVRYEGSLSAIGRLRQSVPRVVSAGRRCTRPRRALRLCSGRENQRCGSAAGIPDASALALPRCPMRVPWCMERTHYSAHGAGEEDMTWHGLRPRRRRRRR